MDEELSGSAMIEAIEASGIEYVPALPDITTVEGLLKPLRTRRRPRLLQICKEDEGVAICAGLAYTGRRALLLMQSTGLLDSLNAIRAVACEYAQPVCMMVGLIGREPRLPPAASASFGVRIIEPILQTMGVRHLLIDTTRDVSRIQPAIEEAYARSQPLALLIGRPPW